MGTLTSDKVTEEVSGEFFLYNNLSKPNNSDREIIKRKIHIKTWLNWTALQLPALTVF